MGKRNRNKEKVIKPAVIIPVVFPILNGNNSTVSTIEAMKKPEPIEKEEKIEENSAIASSSLSEGGSNDNSSASCPTYYDDMWQGLRRAFARAPVMTNRSSFDW